MSSTAAPPPRSPDSDGPRQVSKFEFNLLHVLRFFLGHFPTDQGLQLVRAPIARPDCLTETAVELIKDSLAKASVLFLVREGGWRNDRYLRANSPTAGRVWDRIPLDERALTFSQHVVEFLLWATAEKVDETKVPWDAPTDELTPADEFFFWRVFDSCRSDQDLVTVLRRKEAFRRNPLCWISSPGDLAENEEFEVPDFARMFVGLRPALVECLQAHLTQRWIRSERAKVQIGDWKKMRSQGRAEYAALRAFLTAAEEVRRPDLARFVLKTNAAILTSDLSPTFWTGGLQGSGPPRLADRLDTQRAALAVPRQMEMLEAWQQRAVYVGFFDEGYHASQMWKQEWEEADGDRIAGRARHAVEMLEPLRGPAQPQVPTEGRPATDATRNNPG
jgi:hypothetical protein